MYFTKAITMSSDALFITQIGSFMKIFYILDEWFFHCNLIVFMLFPKLAFQGEIVVPRSFVLLFLFLKYSVQFSSVQWLSRVQLFATPWTAAHQASLSMTNSWSLFKLMSIELVMPSNHLILCHPLILLPSIFPSIRVFSNETAFCIRWPKYWSVSFNISPSNEHSGLISLRKDWLDLLAVQGTLKSLL